MKPFLCLILVMLLQSPAHAFMLGFGSAGAMTGDQKVFINELLSEFRKAHPDAQIELRDSTSYIQPIAETLMAKHGSNAPDLGVVGLVEWPVLYRKSLLQPFEAVLSPAELKKIQKSLRPQLTVQYYGARVNDKEFALPFNRSISVMFVNKTLLPKLGDKPPTWKELFATLHKSQRERPSDATAYKIAVPTDDWIAEAILVNARGATTLRGDRAMLTDLRTVEMIKLLHDEAAAKAVAFVPSQHQAYQDFLDRKVAAAIVSLSTFKSIKSRAGFPFAVSLPPDAGSHATVLGGGDLIFTASRDGILTEKERRDIKNFLVWFYLGKGSARWSEISGFLDPRRGSGPEQLYEKHHWRIESLYAINDFCNIVPIRQGVARVFKEAIASDDPAAVLKQGETYLSDLVHQPCP